MFIKTHRGRAGSSSGEESMVGKVEKERMLKWLSK